MPYLCIWSMLTVSWIHIHQAPWRGDPEQSRAIIGCLTAILSRPKVFNVKRISNHSQVYMHTQDNGSSPSRSSLLTMNVSRDKRFTSLRVSKCRQIWLRYLTQNHPLGERGVLAQLYRVKPFGTYGCSELSILVSHHFTRIPAEAIICATQIVFCNLPQALETLTSHCFRITRKPQV